MLVFIFSSCSSPSLNDYKHEGEAVSRMLIAELKQIRSKDDLVIHTSRLKELFDRLVDVIIRAQQFKDSHPEVSMDNVFLEEAVESDQLRMELNRVLHMEGGREIIEKTQEAALNRLDTFEKSRLQNIGK